MKGIYWERIVSSNFILNVYLKGTHIKRAIDLQFRISSRENNLEIAGLTLNKLRWWLAASRFDVIFELAERTIKLTKLNYK